MVSKRLRNVLPLRLFLPALVLLTVLAAVLWQTTANEAQAYLPPAAISQLPLDSANDDPWGIWVGADTVWVSDPSDRKLYAYTKNPWRRDSAKDFSLSSRNTESRGIWSDGTHMFVANFNPKIAYAYKMSDRSYNAAKNIPLDSSANDKPAGMWGDHRNIWVGNTGIFGSTARLVSYDAANSFREGRNRDESEDFDALTVAGNTSPVGIFGDGRVMWVADSGDGKVYAYDQLSQHRLGDRDFDLDIDNSSPRGIWSNGNDMWVVDSGDNAIYVYERTRTEIWSATLTVGYVGPTADGFWANPASGSLTDTTFNDKDASQGHEITIGALIETNGPSLAIGFNRQLLSKSVASYQLHVGNDTYDLADATVITYQGLHVYSWPRSPTWSVNDTIDVSITALPVVTVARVNTQVQHGLSAQAIAHFRYSRTGDTSEPLYFNLKYNELSLTSSSVIKAGKSTRDQKHIAMDTDASNDPICSVTFTVEPGDGYLVGSSSSQTVNVSGPGMTCMGGM